VPRDQKRQGLKGIDACLQDTVLSFEFFHIRLSKQLGKKVKTHKCLVVLGALFFIVFLFVPEGYSFTIDASAGPGGSISPSGQVQVPAGADQTFAIMPDLGYEISDVVTDSGSVGPVSSYTFTDVADDDSIDASFSECVEKVPVYLQGTEPFGTIMGAYDSAVFSALTNFTIVLRAGTLDEEDIVFDEDVSVVLDGGRNCDLTDNYMLTNIPGSLTISAGTATLSNIVISSPALCEPGDPNNFPGNPEICDCLDNNCNGLVDDGLTFDNDGDGYTATGSCYGSRDDCNDNNASIHPFGEIYGDSINQDCIPGDVTSAEQECIDCHGLNFVNNTAHVYTTPPDGTCAGCHAEQVNSILPGHYGQAVKTAGNNMSAGAIIKCFSCHDTDHQGVNPVWQNVVDYYAANGNVTCDACHDISTGDHDHGTESAHDNRVIDSSCAQCHIPLATQADIDTLHQNNCTLCHAYSGTKICVNTVEQAIEDGMNGIQVSCTACHTAHHSPETNQVSYDPAVDTSQSSQQGCAVCHYDYDLVSGEPPVGLSTWEAILVEHDLFEAKDGDASACSTCHASTRQDVQDVIDSGNPATCATCHTDKVPNVDHGIPTSGKHPEHLAMMGISCSTCHLTGSIPYFKSGTDSNGDGMYDLSETDVCELCHQDGSGIPATEEYKDGWHDPGFVLACASCHAIAPSTGSHAVHFGAHAGPPEDIVYGDLRITEDFAAGQVSSVNVLGCGNCHPLDLSYHGNQVWGDMELANEAAPPDSLKALSEDGSYDDATGTCSNVYCHSVNSWTTDGPVPMPWPEADGWDKDVDPLPRPLPDNIVPTRVYKEVTWGSILLGCSSCHAYPPKTSSPDNDGGAGDSHYWVDGYGYQNLHIANLGFDPIPCRTCHYDTVQDWVGWGIDQNTNRWYYKIVAIYDKAKHVNGSADVAFDTVNNYTYNSDWSGNITPIDLTPASYDPGTKTCSAVECHKSEDAVTWGLPYRWFDNTECDRCHNYTGSHIGDTCSDCHGSPPD